MLRYPDSLADIDLQQLSKLVVSHFNTAGHAKSADTVLSDLAILK